MGRLARWFVVAPECMRRNPPGALSFDLVRHRLLHGFPAGMIKSCRRYWTREIADSIASKQLERLRAGAS